MSGVELARRAVACPGWRWMPGMRSLAHHYMLEGREFIAPARRWSEGDGFPQDGRLPDLDDPATLGCLLALVREDWNDPHIYVRKSVTRNQWVAWRKRLRDDDDEVKVSEGRTEDESLVAALEAAPRREAAP